MGSTPDAAEDKAAISSSPKSASSSASPPPSSPREDDRRNPSEAKDDTARELRMTQVRRVENEWGAWFETSNDTPRLHRFWDLAPRAHACAGRRAAPSFR